MKWGLPDKDHPVWKVLQTLASLGLVIVTLYHGESGGHAGGIDTSDVGGAVGIGVGAKLLVQRFLMKS